MKLFPGIVLAGLLFAAGSWAVSTVQNELLETPLRNSNILGGYYSCSSGTFLGVRGNSYVCLSCQNGQYVHSTGRCEATPTCPGGSVLVNSRCETSHTGCPSGSTYNSSSGYCERQPTCPSGMSLQNGVCVSQISCPGGYIRVTALDGSSACIKDPNADAALTSSTRYEAFNPYNRNPSGSVWSNNFVAEANTYDENYLASIYRSSYENYLTSSGYQKNSSGTWSKGWLTFTMKHSLIYRGFNVIGIEYYLERRVRSGNTSTLERREQKQYYFSDTFYREYSNNRFGNRIYRLAKYLGTSASLEYDGSTKFDTKNCEYIEYYGLTAQLAGSSVRKMYAGCAIKRHRFEGKDFQDRVAFHMYFENDAVVSIRGAWNDDLNYGFFDPNGFFISELPNRIGDTGDIVNRWYVPIKRGFYVFEFYKGNNEIAGGNFPSCRERGIARLHHSVFSIWNNCVDVIVFLYFDTASGCQNGTERNGRCEASPNCPSGTYMSNGICVATPNCPSGFSWDFSSKRCVSAPTCPSGMYIDGNRCVSQPRTSPAIFMQRR